MKNFLRELIEGEKFELLIDTSIFSQEIILKASYNFLDKGYFFFKRDEEDNILLQFSKKDGVEDLPEKIILDFSDELLSVSLRDKLEKDNKQIRERIYTSGIGNSLDINNFVELDTDNQVLENNEQIDFDKDIDDILKEIENDPELKIDEEEIENILKEIEEETELEEEETKEELKLDMDGLEEAKKEINKNSNDK